MQKNDTKFVLTSFIVWRLALQVIYYFGKGLVPLQEKYLGGELDNYLNKPWLWSWANFDGLHYLQIATKGYKFPLYFFFPGYPMLVPLTASIIGNSQIIAVYMGLMISHLAFILGLIGLAKLLLLDYKIKFSRSVIILLLVFPTSYYFASLYTESLFFFFSIWTFYQARKKRWLLAAVLGACASATRSIGVILLPVLLIEYFQEKDNLPKFDVINKENFRKLIKVLPLFLIPLGLGLYMLFLQIVTGDPFAFNTSGTKIFGEYRSATPIMLPRVFYRYIFKILPNINWHYFPVVFTTVLEFGTGLLLLFISFFAITRIRLSYFIFMVLGYLIPTMYLSFVSLPRYFLILFPAFVTLTLILNKFSNKLRFFVYLVSFVLLVVATTMFLQGYWVS